jgi:hypothetical protein
MSVLLRWLSNDRLYLVYFWALLIGALLVALLRAVGVISDRVSLGGGLTAQVIRGPESMGILTAAYTRVALSLGSVSQN